jgi:hypothetical protein
LLIHVKIRLAHLAGNRDGLGADALGHILELADQMRDDIQARQDLARSAAVGFKWQRGWLWHRDF